MEEIYAVGIFTFLSCLAIGFVKMLSILIDRT
jgi:hypothetical protein